jgi:6-pyruvoyltetrahydropterin/6-carboxytetrahydropterin synthase
MFEVTVSARFMATHQVPEPSGQPEPLHGHEWRVRVTYAGPQLDGAGFLVDFGMVKEALAAALAPLSGRNLNQVPELAGCWPTAEHVAAFIAEQVPRALPGDVRLACVEVEEEAGCWARYRPFVAR